MYIILIVFLIVLPPPVDVRATQSSPSSPVEVSWSPPTDQGAFNITGYRIFYGCSGENVSMPAAATSIGLRVEGGYEHQRVSLRSESDDLYSELVNVTVGKVLIVVCITIMALIQNVVLFSDYDMAKYPCGCSREIGATIGVMICLVTVATIIVITVLHWWR